MKITINYKLDNWNDIIDQNRRNKYAGASIKKKEMSVIRLFLLNTPKIEKYPIKIRCIWHITNINSDLDNKSIKSVLDAMQKYGILENDNLKHISKISHEYILDKVDYLEMEIEEDI